MTSSFERLVDWAECLIRHRDLYHKKIVSLDKNEQGFTITYKDSEEQVIVDPFMDQLDKTFEAAEAHPERKTSLICYNTENNLKKMLEHWKQASAFRMLWISFVNPFSSADVKWIINPRTHDKISDPETLELGLKTLAEGVTLLTKEEVRSQL